MLSVIHSMINSQLRPSPYRLDAAKPDVKFNTSLGRFESLSIEDVVNNDDGKLAIDTIPYKLDAATPYVASISIGRFE